MNFSIVLLVLAFFGAANAAWVQVWSDEFNGNALSDGEWVYETGGSGWGNNELEFYTAHRAENVRVAGGHLTIHVNVEDYQGKHFTSARLHSKKAWTYGRFEARAKLPKGKHLWPAIWMMPSQSAYGGWPTSGEIDIMEQRGERPTVSQSTLHYGHTHASMGSGEHNFGVDLSADFHTYAVEWNQKEMSFFVDSNKYYTANIDKNLGGYNHNGAPFDKPFFWILNVAVGGNFFNGMGAEVTPAEAKGWAKPTMEVDYLRVFEWR